MPLGMADASRRFGEIVVRGGMIPSARRAAGGPAPWPPRGAQVLIVRQGAVSVRCDENTGRTKTFTAGQGLFAADPADIAIVAHRDAEVVSLTVPTDLWEGVPALPARKVVRVQSQLTGSVAEFAASVLLLPAPDASTFGPHRVGLVLREMLSALLSATGIAHARQDAPPPALARARSVIAARHTDQELTVEDVAREVSLSVRQLQRLFRAEGTPVTEVIRQARVEHARTLLHSRRYDGLGVDEIARRVGFSGGSSLARAAAAMGLPSPARMRREAAHATRSARARHAGDACRPVRSAG